MEGLSFIVGVIGNVISVLVFLCPVWTFWKIIKQGSTEDFESIPYVCTLLNSSLWTYYGITRPGAYIVATVNGFGILAEAVYVVKTGILVGILDVGFLGAAVLVTRLALEGETRIDAIGFMCGSPLAAMVRQVSNKLISNLLHSIGLIPYFLTYFLLDGIKIKL
ncbi:hypothetical protein GQ457_14G016110 [Hibiscus cannabinus]